MFNDSIHVRNASPYPVDKLVKGRTVMPNETRDPSVPYQVDSGFELEAIGSWSNGGVLEIRYQGKRTDILTLTASEWTAMATLIKASLESKDDHWATAFVLAEKLGPTVQRLSHRGDKTAAAAHAVVHRLRRLLSESKAAQFSAGGEQSSEGWGKLVIEKHLRFGYRVSIEPKQLTLFMLKDPEEEDDD